MTMACLILAAGLGTRMRPLTDHMPKPMVPVAGKPIIDYVLKMVKQAHCHPVIMNVHYLPDSLIDYARGKIPDMIISDEREALLDSGGGIAKVLTSFTQEHFFVINADCIWQSPINALLQLQKVYNPSKMDILKLLYPSQQAIGFDEKNIYKLDSHGKIIRTDNADYAFTGIQLMNRHLIEDYCKQNPTKNIFSIRHLWEQAQQQNRFYGVAFEGDWLHIGTPQSVLDAEYFLLKQ